MSMKLIATATVGAGGAANFTFNSIPADATDLLFLISARNADGFSLRNTNYYVTFNNVQSNISRQLWGTGSSAQSYSGVEIQGMNGSASTSNIFSNHRIYVANYTSTASKTFSIDTVQENNGANAYQVISAGLTTTTSAISSCVITPEYGTLVSGSTASLYTITKA